MGAADLASTAASATPWGAIIQGGLGAIQTIGGMIQRSKGLKEAKKAIQGLGPNQGILDYYNQTRFCLREDFSKNILFVLYKTQLRENYVVLHLGLNLRKYILVQY